MGQVEAVVFDSDGTLFKTDRMIVGAYQAVARQHGLRPPTRDEIMVHMGKALHDIYAGLFPDYDAQVLVAANGAYILEHLLEVEPYAGMESMLQTLHTDGVRLAILTGGNHKVLDVLEHHRAQQYFDSIVHSERVTKPKPDPEGLYLALEELGVAAEHALVVGDMRYDILTGKNGHAMATIGVTHGFGSREELQEAGADYIVDDLPSALARIQALDR